MIKRNFQITCRCSAYTFPHRLNGGNCSGTEWAESYSLYIKEECTYCNCLVDQSCEVATGQEDIVNCEAYNNIYHTLEEIKLPIDEEEYYKELENLNQTYQEN